MPLVTIRKIDEGVRLALWKMTEATDDLPRPGIDFTDIHSEVRLREKIVEYCMLRVLTHNGDLVIRHLPTGQPIVDGYSLSISHTRGWAAMVVSEDDVPLGVDIEYVSERVNKVADRFIRPDEQSDSLAYRLINWSAKESVYKALSSEDLQYFEMRLRPYSASSEGDVIVEDLKEPKERKVHYVLKRDYVLTWAVL